jgi:nucleotide-binding universal stress UspA family protein
VNKHRVKTHTDDIPLAGNRILCAVDFSESSLHALRWAASLARQFDEHLTILYTYRLIKPTHGHALEMKRKIEEDSLQHFQLLEKEYLTDPLLSYDFQMEIGFMADRITDQLRHNHISFLVMDKSMHVVNKEMFDDLVGRLAIPLVLVP